MRALVGLAVALLLAPGAAAAGVEGGSEGCQGLPGVLEACRCPAGFMMGAEVRVLGGSTFVCFF